MIRNKYDDIIQSAAEIFTESLDLQFSLNEILKILDNQLGLNFGTVTLLDEESEKIKIEVAHGLKDEDIIDVDYAIGEGITGKVVQSGQAVIVANVNSDTRFLNKTEKRNKKSKEKTAFICVPIKHKGFTLGALSVDKKYPGKIDFEKTVDLLKIIALFIAQAVKIQNMANEKNLDLKKENLSLKLKLSKKFNMNSMIGNSNAMLSVYREIEQVKDSKATVLIRGGSGTGKELVANALHYNSINRKNKPFIKINCTAFPEALLESELFGHEKGSFTGAHERKIGRFELANGGTVFLDEIGDISLNLQVKLLRVIQHKQFERVGGTTTIKSDIRLIAATHKNLEEEIRENRFREDLYYRINVFPIFMPLLKDRKDDIMLLADHFLGIYSKENNKSINRISTPAIESLTSYHWPGNIRELENTLERAVLVCDGDVIRSEHLPPSLQLGSESNGDGINLSLEKLTENFEKERIIDSLKKCNGHQGNASDLLGITARILGYKLKKYSILPKIYS